MRIVVDAMGGDKAPYEIVKGSLLAANQFKNVEIILAGEQKELEKLLVSSFRPIPRNIGILHASQVVGMEEPGVTALRQKTDSSITKAIQLVAKGEAVAVVSAGNTGAAVAASTMHLKMLKGVTRPGIVAALPTRRGYCIVADVGANLKCKPIHLLQYAVMSSVFCKYSQGIKKPRVGLLNIGEESGKGNDLVKESYNLLKESNLNFVGNVEGMDLFEGKCDIVICEGFVGNVLIKFAEGIADGLLGALGDAASKRPWSRIGLRLLRPAVRRVRARMDYSEYGGVPLLGVDGICIICHGRSDFKSIQNAIKEAIQFAKHNVNAHIVTELEANHVEQENMVGVATGKGVC
ncbi:MAG TPA: phosphate acyltransferase PlsX [Candidatus Tripitaka californicus]|uniref:phosphate acyltransferase PlsX n=1 Tax=Candidatus Tripitaka californicus TaxID=3367616 RepID=UPI004025AC4A|nr:phosphate acyltransferase PlsX [Planctomycetota bacterium]